LTDFALQFRDPVIVGPFPARAHKSLRAVLVQFPAPPVQIARMNLQRPGHFRRALATRQLPNRRLFELPAELPSLLHFRFSPFNDFQGLIGCLKNGVQSTALQQSSEPSQSEAPLLPRTFPCLRRSQG
jgi:hypothetical protein